MSSGITRGKALIAGLAFFGLGGQGYWGFQAAGRDGCAAGIAAQAGRVAWVLHWTGFPILRVL